MRNVLVGNGVIIQHGGTDYLNAAIIQRALDKIRSGNFPSHLYPPVCADFVVALREEHAAALKGEYDNYVFTSYDRASLEDFKKRYNNHHSYSITEIGFEDYFLLFELVHNKQGVGNPDRFNSRGVFRRMFLDAVFNDGKIESVNEQFEPRFVEWLKQHDHIFTTNYDSNLDIATGLGVHHLHGSFKTLSEIYTPDSFRNQLEDDLLDGEIMDPKYPHLYSTCLVSYVGDLKSHSMTQSSLANSGMEKFVSAYQNDTEYRKRIDELDESIDLVRRLKEAIRLKAANPELRHAQQYPHDLLKEISGTLEIVGLSPNNDGHLFTQILENDQITKITFNYFGDQEARDAEQLFVSKNLFIQDVREFWSEYES
ncbi:MAG: hypothetical protein KDA77_00155 [Planctomycetaceae bacterium]|nr:hypothetical protein [Planctomycetaceae bacterium]